jgi:hypothetical protein
MAYDPQTNETVLFGGENNGTVFDDTWTWKGSTWTQQFPATSPPVQSITPAAVYDAMVYDAASGQLLLFDGSTSDGTSSTWIWSGTNWIQQSPTTNPPAVSGVSMAYDAASNDVVLFGGSGSSNGTVTYTAETWLWSGSNWTEQSPADSPPGRELASMAYDSATQQVVLFGGNQGGPSYSSSDTWTWDGTNWTQQFPSTSPPERLGAAAIYDSAAGGVLLFGGYDEVSSSWDADTWVWTGGNWTQLTLPLSPSPRSEAAISDDPATGNPMLFGGFVDLGSVGDTWIFEPTAVPSITAQPESQSTTAGTPLTFTAAVTGIPTPTVQWQESVDGGNTWANIPGATSASYTTADLAPAMNGWEVRAVFTNAVGSATTNPATITVTPSTTVVLPSNNATMSASQWLDAVASPGVTTLNFVLSGEPGSPFTGLILHSTAWIYGWLGELDTTTVPNGTYILESVGAYPGGVTTSQPVTITVENPPPPVTIILPSNDATVAGSQGLDALAPAGANQVQYELSGGPSDLSDSVIATLTAPTIYGWAGKWDTTIVSNGTYTLQSVASYPGGVTETSQVVTVNVNNPPPSTTVVLPANGVTVSESNPLTVDAVASPGVTQVQIDLTASGGENFTVTTTPTIYGWIGEFYEPCTPDCSGSIPIPVTVQAVASYAGGVTGRSVPVYITVLAQLPQGDG